MPTADAMGRGAALTRLVGALLAAALPGCAPVAAPDDLASQFDGGRALRVAGELVALGPRPPGSPELDSSRRMLRGWLEECGWEVEFQQFESPTPFGPTRFVNVLARRPGARPDIILASHIDTKIYREFRFVGANDGASSTAALVELGRVLDAHAPRLAERIEFAFFDGEECFVEYSESDGLYGSRHFVEQLRAQRRVGQYSQGILLDMVGDRDLEITFPADSPPQLARLFFEASSDLGLRRHFSLWHQNILDDHVPLNRAGIPTIDVIDFDYPPWHTPGDTLDKLSAESLRIVGSVTLEVLRRIGRGEGVKSDPGH